MKYTEKIREFLINKKKKKKFEQLIEEKKSDIYYSNKYKIGNDKHSQDLEYIKDDPILNKFYERYNEIKIKRIQNKSIVNENKNRRQIFIEISEKINNIKQHRDKNVNGNYFTINSKNVNIN